MEWSDVVTIVLVLAGIWYILVPAPVRRAASAGFGPAVHAAADHVRGMVRAVAPFVRWLAYDVLLGVKDAPITSSGAAHAPVPESRGTAFPRQERPLERAGTGAAEQVPALVPGSLVDRLGRLPHEELIGALALLKDDDGEWRYAESRLAKFAGGRVEDRQREIRALRGETPPPPPNQLTYRVNGQEHSISR